MALGSMQPLTEMSNGVFPGGRDGRCVRLTLPPSCAVVMKYGNLNFLLGHSRPVTGLLYLYFPKNPQQNVLERLLLDFYQGPSTNCKENIAIFRRKTIDNCGIILNKLHLVSLNFSDIRRNKR
jgi:hypothetical protein